MNRKHAKRPTFCRSCGAPMGERTVSRFAVDKAYCGDCFGVRTPGLVSRGGYTADELAGELAWNDGSRRRGPARSES